MPLTKGSCVPHAHTTSVKAISWSPDSTQIASATLDDMVQIWDVRTGEGLGQYHHHTHSVNAVTWSPTGKYLASADAGATIHVWQPFKERNDLIYQGDSNWIQALTWSPDEHYIVSVGGNLVEVRNILTGAVVHHFFHTFPMNDAAWMPFGESIALACEDAVVKVWNLSTDQMTSFGCRDIVFAITWSPDGRYTASACFDGSIFIHEPLKQKTIAEYRPHTEQVFTVAWSPSGRYIAFAGENGTVHIWDVLQATPALEYLAHSAAVVDLAWSPNGKYLASASYDHTVQVCEMRE